MKTVHIGELIKKVAKEKRLTDDEIGEGVNLSRTGVQRTYNEADMSTAKLRKFSEFLEYDFFSHLTESAYPATNTTQNDFLEPKEKYALNQSEVSVVLKIPRDKQQEIIKIVFG